MNANHDALFDIVRRGYGAGLCIIPPTEDGKKSPEPERVSESRLAGQIIGEAEARKRCGDKGYAATWVHYQYERPSTDQMAAWYRDGQRSGMGIVCGAISGNVELFEFDSIDVYRTFKDTAEAIDLDDLVERIEAGYLEETPGGGIHWFYRCDEISGNTKLAQRPGPPDDNGNPTVDTVIETRGEGGYGITAPTNGRVHPTGGCYRLLRGGVDSIVTITPDERRALWHLAESFDDMPKREPEPIPQPRQRRADEGQRPGEDYDRRGDWYTLLSRHGWQRMYAHGDKEFYRRPNKPSHEPGHSAMVYTAADGFRKFVVYSTSAHPFDYHRTGERIAYSLFRAYALLEHNRDYSAAARELGRQGYGEQSPSIVVGSRTARQHDNGTYAEDESESSIDADKWPERQPLPPLLPAVPTLPADMVPAAFREWLEDIAARAVIPLEYPTVAAIVATSAVIGRRFGIRPSAYDDYTVVPNLWGAPIGRPGWMKSYAISEPLKPLARLEHEARERFQKQQQDNSSKIDRLQAEIAGLKQAISASVKATKRETNPDELEKQIATKKAEIAELDVKQRRYQTQDATVEKLGELLSENPYGMLVLRDELAGWLRTLDKAGREGDREFFLESWNGTGSYTFDRIGRGTVHIPAVCISLLGSIQPGKMRPLIRGAVDDGVGADGLLQRLQLVVWPDRLGEWKTVNRRPDTAAKERAYTLFQRLDTVKPQEVGATIGEFAAVPYLQFTPTAQAVFDAWREALEKRLRSDELSAYPAFESHISKYRSLMPSLALIFHLLSVLSVTYADASGGVSESAARLAAGWCDFLEEHARKVYAPELNADADAAHALAEKIEAGAVKDGATIRELYRAQWSGLAKPDQVFTAITRLTALGWLRVEAKETGGRPQELLRLHPELADVQATSGGETDD